MKKNIKLMYVFNLVSELKLFGVIAILYYIEITDSMMLGMSIYSISTIVSSLFEIPTGLISDKIGRKFTIVIGSVFSLIYIILLSLAKNYMDLVFAAILNGIEISFFSGNNQAYLYDNLEKEKMGKEYQSYAGKLNSMIYLAGAIASASGGIMVYFTSYRFVVALSIIPKIIQLIISFNLKNITEFTNSEKAITQLKNATKEVLNNKNLKKQIIADSINEGVSEACYQFRSTFYSMVWEEWALGIPGILSNIGAYISNWFGRKNDKKIWKT